MQCAINSTLMYLPIVQLFIESRGVLRNFENTKNEAPPNIQTQMTFFHASSNNYATHWVTVKISILLS